jgi:hypothetical protein
MTTGQPGFPGNDERAPPALQRLSILAGVLVADGAMGGGRSTLKNRPSLFASTQCGLSATAAP